MNRLGSAGRVAVRIGGGSGAGFVRALVLVTGWAVLHGVTAPALAGEGGTEALEVVAHHPQKNGFASVEARIRVTFDRPVDPATLGCGSSFWAFGRWSGKAAGEFVMAEGGRTVVLIPDEPFAAGETVTVLLSHDLRGIDGVPLRGAGYSFQFWTRAEPAPRTFTSVQVKSTNLAGESSRPYGGVAADLDGNGFPDLAIVNEDSNDVRVFLNLADCTSEMSDVVTPVAPTGAKGSPSETADFDGDGHMDLCVANFNGNSISVLLGNGDGTFQPQQEIGGADDAHGIAVLDADGDGDFDIATSNQGTNSMALYLNDGNGVFGAPSHFNAGIAGEWVVAASDMDCDGILDLVVGGRSSSSIAVLMGNGNATFDVEQVTNAGGQVWMLVVGDLDGNGYPDVTTANGISNTASILMNTNAMLGAPTVYPIDPFGTATDVGDLDGDGDLDWVTSSFGGDYTLFENDGSGNFTVDRTLPAPSNGSCALLVDFDLDGDLDLALVDEIDDTVTIYRNGDAGVDCDANGTPDACDIASGTHADCNGNGIPDACDVASGAELDLDENGVPDVCETVVASCGVGAVDVACGSAAHDVLRLNGRTGGDTRALAIEPSTPIVLTIAEAPGLRCDGIPSASCVYAWSRAPQTRDVVAIPLGLGSMCFGPAPVSTRPVRVLWNAIGFPQRLGADGAPGPPPVIPDGGCFELLSLPSGLGFEAVATVQGFVEDDCSQGSLPYSVTNAITVTVALSSR